MKKWDFSLITKYRGEIFGIAALLIVLFHGNSHRMYYLPDAWFFSKLSIILKHGLGGVDVFLFLSGIGVYFSMESSSVSAFYKKRVHRLIPPYLVIAFVFYAWRYLLHTLRPIRFIGAITQVNLFILGDHYYWFIPAIAIFYLLTPLVLQYLKKGNRTLRMAALITGIVLVNLFLRRHCKEFWSNAEIVTTRFATYVFGCYIGKYVKEKTPMPWWVVGLTVLIVVSFPVVIIKWRPVSVDRRFYYGVYGTSLVFVLSMLIDLIHIKPLKKLFLYVGGLSNELYLSHVTLFSSIKILKLNKLPIWENNSAVFFLLAVIASFLVAIAIQKVCGAWDTLREKLAARPQPETRTLPLSPDGRVLLWDNLKFLLILMVVVGTSLDGYSSKSFRSLSLFLSSMSMPMLVFAAGMFHRNTRVLQKMLRYLGCYAIMLSLLFGIRRVCGIEANLELISTADAPWFFFALALFVGLSFVLRDVNKRAVLVISVFVACVAGYDTTVGDRFMLSRILVFFPFYLLGTMVTREKLLALRRRPSLRIGAGAVLLLWAALCLFCRNELKGLLPLFAGRSAYGDEIFRLGFWYRLLCMTLSATLGLSLILLVPARNLGVFSIAGRRTLSIYFWHCPILCILIYQGARENLCDTRLGKILWLALAFVLTVVLAADLFGFPAETLQRLLKANDPSGPPPET